MADIPVVTQIVQFYTPWETLPNLGTVDTPPRPLERTPREPIRIEFSDAELRDRICAVENGFGGLRCTQESISVLPPGWLTAVYTNVRFMAAVPNNIFPIVASSSYTTRPHALAGLVCMSLLFQSLWDEYRFYVKPDEIKRANDVKRRLNQINYVLYQSLLTNPTGVKSADIIVGNLLTATSVGTGVNKVVEQKRTIYFDALNFQTYLDAGGSLEDALDHYLTTNTQPTV